MAFPYIRYDIMTRSRSNNNNNNNNNNINNNNNNNNNKFNKPALTKKRSRNDFDEYSSDACEMKRIKYSHKNIFVGTSGYSYNHWHQAGSFYPKGTRGKELEYYMAQFNSVEINYTHYVMPSKETVEKWKLQSEQRNPNFIFVIKVHMWFTHMKLLKIDTLFKDKWQIFWDTCQLLHNNLGPFLFQFPSRFKLDLTTEPNNLRRLRDLAALLPASGRYVFEFRDASWYREEVYSLFNENNNWCLCQIHVTNKRGWAGTLTSGYWPRDPLTNICSTSCNWGVYYRFHGSKGQYEGEYNNQLDFMEGNVKNWLSNGKTVYVYFNNTDNCKPSSAISDAKYISQLISVNL